MPKKTKSTKTEPRLPSREDLVAFIANASGKVGKREIARAFNIQGGDRIWLKQILKELETDGVVDRRRKGVSKTGQLPPVIVADVTGRDRDGELIASPEEWDAEAHGPAPKIIVTMPRKPRPGQPVPGVGDRVLLRLERLTEDGKHRYAGRVIKIIGKQKSQVLGIFRANPAGGGRLVPVDKKARGVEVLIPPGAEGGARDGSSDGQGSVAPEQAPGRAQHGFVDHPSVVVDEDATVGGGGPVQHALGVGALLGRRREDGLHDGDLLGVDGLHGTEPGGAELAHDGFEAREVVDVAGDRAQWGTDPGGRRRDDELGPQRPQHRGHS